MTRAVLLRHRWAIGLMDSRRTPGPATLQHHDAMLGCLREAGFSLDLAGHVFATLDAHLYGFVLQEVALPFEGDAGAAELAHELLGCPVSRWPGGRRGVPTARELSRRPGFRAASDQRPRPPRTCMAR